MKKVLALCLTLVMVVALAVPAFAGLGGFVSSPSGNSAPQLKDYYNEDHECTASLVITSYADRYTLDDETRAMIEEAYGTIVGTDDVTTLNADLAKLAKDMKIDPSKLAVSDLFDISYYSCPQHSEHGKFFITISAETLKNFVGLMHYDGENWELISDAKIEDGDLVFSVDDLSPFAIVVDTSAGSPITGDFSNIGFYAVVMVVSAVALVVVAVKLKKRELN